MERPGVARSGGAGDRRGSRPHGRSPRSSAEGQGEGRLRRPEPAPPAIAHGRPPHRARGEGPEPRIGVNHPAEARRRLVETRSPKRGAASGARLRAGGSRRGRRLESPPKGRARARGFDGSCVVSVRRRSSTNTPSRPRAPFERACQVIGKGTARIRRSRRRCGGGRWRRAARDPAPAAGAPRRRKRGPSGPQRRRWAPWPAPGPRRPGR